jgi:hypothetical protein
MSLANEEPRALVERLMADNTAGHELICESSSSQLLVRLSEYSRRHAVLPALPLAGSAAPRITTNPPSRALGELFGPIRVNPNSRRRTELTIRSFVHGKPGGLPASYQTAIPVNGSDQEIEAFVRMLIERSRAQRSVHHASVADCRRFDLVSGERGVG